MILQIRDTSSCGPANVNRLNDLFVGSLGNLGYKSTKPSQILKWARIVCACMSSPGRTYHNVPHLYDVTRDMSSSKHPIPVLAALFHDVVYLSIDKEVNKELVAENLLSDLVLEGEPFGSALSWKPAPPTCTSTSSSSSSSATQRQRRKMGEDSDRWCVEVVDSVFGGVTPRNVNEYLSAVVAARALQDTISAKHLVQIIACIEATVPFRANEPDGTTPMEGLHRRIKDTIERNKKDGWGCKNHPKLDMTKEELVETVQQACFCASCDLGSFHSDDPYYFMDTSWKLLPEWSPGLADPQPQLTDLRAALRLLPVRYQGMPIQFLFPNFANVPADLEEHTKRARKNLKVVGEYAWMRLLGIETIVEALALGLGGENQVEAAVSEIGGVAVFWKRFHKACQGSSLINAGSTSVSSLEPEKPEGWNKEVRDMLVKGRRTGYDWDPAKAPWEAHLYEALGPKKTQELGKKMAGDEENARWLPLLPVDCLNELTEVLQEVFPEKSKSLAKIRRSKKGRTAVN